MKYAIFAGLNGGFGGATYQHTDEFETYEDALDFAYGLACLMYDRLEGLYGLPNWEAIRDELSKAYDPDEEPSEDDIYELYIERRDNWLDYRVEEYEEGKDYE